MLKAQLEVAITYQISTVSAAHAESTTRSRHYQLCAAHAESATRSRHYQISTVSAAHAESTTRSRHYQCSKCSTCSKHK